MNLTHACANVQGRTATSAAHLAQHILALPKCSCAIPRAAVTAAGAGQQKTPFFAIHDPACSEPCSLAPGSSPEHALALRGSACFLLLGAQPLLRNRPPSSDASTARGHHDPGGKLLPQLPPPWLHHQLLCWPQPAAQRMWFQAPQAGSPALLRRPSHQGRQRRKRPRYPGCSRCMHAGGWLQGVHRGMQTSTCALSVPQRAP